MSGTAWMMRQGAVLLALFLFFSPRLFAAPPKEWLVLVYMAADNNLSPYSFHDLWEMERVGSSDTADVVVFHDELRPDGIRYYHLERNPSQPDYRPRFDAFVREKKLTSEEPALREEVFWESEGPKLLHSKPVRHLPEGDSGDVKTLGTFLRWALLQFPSRRVFFTGWSHGDGYDAKWRKARRGGFAFDDTSGSHMAVNQMAAELKRVLDETRDGRPFDIAGSDACLNQQLEIGYEWLGLAHYIFGSAAVVPKKGFNYQSLLDWITGSPSVSTAEIAAGIPAIYRETVPASSEFPLVTMVTWRVAELIPLKLHLDALATSLLAWIEEPGSLLGRITRAEALKTLVQRARRFAGISSDLSVLLSSLIDWGKAHGQAPIVLAAVRADGALDRSVAAKYIGILPEAGPASKGVSLWIPQSERDFERLFSKYGHSRFYRENGSPDLSPWGQFIARLYRPQ